MLQLASLSGKRESSEAVELTPRVRVLNGGGLRLNNAAIEHLGLEKDKVEYVAVAGEGQIYIALGQAHTVVLNEKGEPETTGAGKIKTEGDGYGSKVKFSTHTKPNGTFSSAAAHINLRAFSGKDNFEGVVLFTLGEAVEANVETGNELYPNHTAMFYPLVFEKAIENEKDDVEDVAKEVEVSEEELKAQNTDTDAQVDEATSQEEAPVAQKDATESANEDWGAI